MALIMCKSIATNSELWIKSEIVEKKIGLAQPKLGRTLQKLFLQFTFG